MTDVRIETSWKKSLQDEFEKPYFLELTKFVRDEYVGKKVYPPPMSIFAAFDACPLDRVEVVILGQDPYHGPKQANGLCFSVSPEVALPPSLQNIFKEVESDLGVRVERNDTGVWNGDLTRWARQGVLLLNATLTVEAGRAGSHQRHGWEQFTDCVIELLSEKRDHLVFILWGRYAQEKGAVIDTAKHCVIKSAHPSPLSASNGFFGSRPFSQANAYLTSVGKPIIDWR